MLKESFKPQENLPKTPEKTFAKPKSFFENALDAGKRFKTASDAFDTKITGGLTKMFSRGINVLNETVMQDTKTTLENIQNLGKATVREANTKIEDARVTRNTIENNKRLAILNQQSQDFNERDVQRLETLKRQLAAKDALEAERQKYRNRTAA